MTDKIDTEPDTSKPLLNWTDEQKTAFQELWKLFTGNKTDDLKRLGINIVIWMYDNVEGAKEVFVNVSQTSNLLLAVDERFLKHSQSVIISIDGVIKHLKDDAAYEDKLYELVHQHLLLVDPPVTEIYFERFRDKFHLFVTEMTGLPENSEACELWYQFLDAVARCCKRERYMMAEKEKSKASCTNCCSML